MTALLACYLFEHSASFWILLMDFHEVSFLLDTVTDNFLSVQIVNHSERFVWIYMVQPVLQCSLD